MPLHRLSLLPALAAVLIAGLLLSAPESQAVPPPPPRTVCVYVAPSIVGSKVNDCTHAGFGAGDDFTTISAALADVASGDRIQVEPGNYDPRVDIAGKSNITIFGDPASAKRPVFTGAGSHSSTVFVETTASGVVLKHLELDSPASASVGLEVDGGPANTFEADDVAIVAAQGCATIQDVASLTDVTATTTSNLCVQTLALATITGGSFTANGGGSLLPGEALLMTHDGLIDGATVSAPNGNGLVATLGTGGSIRATHVHITAGGDGVEFSSTGLNKGLLLDNSLVVVSGTPAIGVDVEDGAWVSLRSDTVIANGSAAFSGYGLVARKGKGSETTAAIANVQSSILRGTADDVFGESDAHPTGPSIACDDGAGHDRPCQPAQVTLDHSDVRTPFSDTVVDGGGNLSSDPLFADATPGPSQNFHLQDASPAIGAGAVASGDTDLDGVARPSGGTRPDLGAFESALGTPVLPTPTPTPTATSTPTPGTTVATGAAGSGGGSSPFTVTVPPSNAFSIIGKPTEGAKGAITFVLAGPGPGAFAAESTLPPVRSTKKAKKGAKPAPLISFGTGALAAPAKGNVSLTIAPSAQGAAAVKALKGSKQFQIAVSLTFTPTGGIAKTVTTTVRVGVPPNHKAKKKR